MKILDQDYIIHINQEFKENQIILHDLHKKKIYPPHVQNLIDSEWQEVKKNRDILIFNGPVSCLDSFTLVENNLHIDYCESDYKSYYGTNIRNSRTLKGNAELANTLAVCTVVETSDQKIIIGKRGSHLAEGTSLWHVPGGTIEYYFDRVNHPFEVMKRELLEELNLQNITSMICLGFGENLNFKKPEFLLYTKTELNSIEIAASLHGASDYNEHSEIRFIPRDLIKDFISNNNFTEIGTAAIQLYLEMKKEMY